MVEFSRCVKRMVEQYGRNTDKHLGNMANTLANQMDLSSQQDQQISFQFSVYCLYKIKFLKNVYSKGRG